jgi:hypothetical protein
MRHTLLAALLLVSACTVTPGVPYPTGNTSSAPPVILQDKTMCDMPCCKGIEKPCCKDGMCPMSAAPVKTSKHDSHTDHVHDGDEAMAIDSAYDDVMRDMHTAMASVKPTGNPDIDFAAGMIPHHQGAIDMAKILLEKGTDPKLRRLGRDIIVAQEREIAYMRYWLATNGAMPDSNISNVNVGH